MTTTPTPIPACSHRTHCDGAPATTRLFGEPLCDPCLAAYDAWVETECARSMDDASRMTPNPKPVLPAAA